MQGETQFLQREVLVDKLLRQIHSKSLGQAVTQLLCGDRIQTYVEEAPCGVHRYDRIFNNVTQNTGDLSVYFGKADNRTLGSVV